MTFFVVKNVKIFAVIFNISDNHIKILSLCKGSFRKSLDINFFFGNFREKISGDLFYLLFTFLTSAL